MIREFFAHAGRLFSWTVAGQIVGLLSAPIVARLYGPEAYGLAAFVLTTSATIAIASSGRYEQAIVIAESEQDAAGLQILGSRIIGFIALSVLIACIFVYLFPPQSIADLFGEHLYLLFGIPILAALNGLAFLRRCVLNRAKAFSQVGSAGFSNSVVVPVSRILAGLAAQGNALMLVLSGAVGWGTEVIGLRSRDSRLSEAQRKKSIRPLRHLARKYDDFPKFSLPEGLMANVSIQLPIYTFGFIYSPAVTGLYSLAIRIVRLPVLALSTAVSQVLFRQFEEHRRDGGKMLSPVAKSTGGLFVVSVVIGIPIMVFAEPIFRVVMGERWATAGLYAGILVPWIVSGVAIIPARLAFVITRRQGVWLSSQVGLFLLRVLVLLSAAVFDLEVVVTLWIFSLTNAGYNVFIFLGALILLLRSDAQDASRPDNRPMT